ncbi:MAG: double zinc ribbon domain-containing protein [Treponema sp.]|jgi:ComF family protein|nr:double zinc ribbon domain-containing protein [Treponema sp.]
MKLSHALSFLRELFFPGGCALCGTGLLNAEEARYGLCTECREKLRFEKTKRCNFCGRPLISELDSCISCRENHKSSDPDKTIALFPYYGLYRQLLAAYKFGKNICLGHFLAEKITEAIKLFPFAEMPVLVPVPPRPGKIRKTGWDQIAYLALLLEREKSCRIFRCLRRLPSETQKKLNREKRRGNLKGRIVSDKKVPRVLIIFDDVITTGSTFQACSAALREGGAERVYALSLFYN